MPLACRRTRSRSSDVRSHGDSTAWLGRIGLRLDSPGGKRVYLDPFLNGNPKCPENEREPERCDLIVVSHGHGDHVGDAAGSRSGSTVRSSRRSSCASGSRARESRPTGGALPNKGGTIEVEGIRITLTSGNHSSSTDDGTYSGESCGIVLGLEDGLKLYYAGDTNVFGDMALIARDYRPGRRNSS